MAFGSEQAPGQMSLRPTRYNSFTGCRPPVSSDAASQNPCPGAEWHISLRGSMQRLGMAIIGHENAARRI